MTIAVLNTYIRSRKSRPNVLITYIKVDVTYEIKGEKQKNKANYRMLTNCQLTFNLDNHVMALPTWQTQKFLWFLEMIITKSISLSSVHSELGCTIMY